MGYRHKTIYRHRKPYYSSLNYEDIGREEVNRRLAVVEGLIKERGGTMLPHLDVDTKCRSLRCGRMGNDMVVVDTPSLNEIGKPEESWNLYMILTASSTTKRRANRLLAELNRKLMPTAVAASTVPATC
jgi:hypothetical protein